MNKECSHGSLVSINVSPKGGVPKTPTNNAIIRTMGIVGDSQADKKHHGGIDKAICIYSDEIINILKEEGHPINQGTTGENLTLKGIKWNELSIGDTIAIGEVFLRLTMTATPCSTIKNSFMEGNFNRISDKNFPGFSRWYASVEREGIVELGDLVIHSK